MDASLQQLDEEAMYFEEANFDAPIPEYYLSQMNQSDDTASTSEEK